MTSVTDNSTALVFDRKLQLSNPYHLEEKNFLVRMYSLRPNLGENALLKMTLVGKYVLRAIALFANIYGLKKISQNHHTLLKASIKNSSKTFRIRDTNSQFSSMYFNYYAECYEPDVSAVIELFLNSKSVFIDIGSNWGHHSFSAIIKKGCTAVLFEPNPDVYSDAKRIAFDLGMESSTSIYNLALSNSSGQLTLEQNYFESGIASISQTFSNSSSLTNRHLDKIKKLLQLPSVRHTTDVRTLDSFSLAQADLMKIDAEGVELEILLGAQNTIATLRPFIIFEFHSGDLVEYERFESFFNSVNYKIYTMECLKLDTRSGNYRLSIFAGIPLKKNHQYNLIAAPAEKDFNEASA